MYVLNTTTRKLQIVLSGAVTTNQCDVVTHYEEVGLGEIDSGLAATPSFTNDTTAVDIVAPPEHSGRNRIIRAISVFNRDTTSATVTIRLNDNGTSYNVFKIILLSEEQLYYEDEWGWTVLSDTGSLRTV